MFIGKWILLPLLLALVGYKLIGPMIASPPSDNKKWPAPKRTVPQSEKGRKFQSVREGNQ